MIYVETRGTWREMGRQYGEALRPVLRRTIEYFAPWLLSDPARAAKTAGALRKTIEPKFPQVIEELGGMAEGANLPVDALTTLRFLGESGAALEFQCTNVFMISDDRGPLLARNGDIEPDASVEVQVCRTSRPRDAAANVLLTYCGFIAGVGMNEHGVGIGGSSAHAAHAFPPAGEPNSLVYYDLLHHARSVRDVENAWRDRPIYGKGAICVAADASGDSRVVQLVSGKAPSFIPRVAGRDWQACSNFYQSREYPPASETDYLQNSYARYGRLVHCLENAPIPRKIRSLQTLMTEVANPGFCIVDRDVRFRTAYTTIFDLQGRMLLLADGHPSKAPFRELSL